MIPIFGNNSPSDRCFSSEFVESAASPEVFVERALLSLRKEAIVQIQKGDLNYSVSVGPKIDQIINCLASKSFNISSRPQAIVDQLGFFLLNLENPKKSSIELLEIFNKFPKDVRVFLINSIPKNLQNNFKEDPKILLQIVDSNKTTPIECLMEGLYNGISINKTSNTPIFTFSQDPLIKGYDAFVQKMYEKIVVKLCDAKSWHDIKDFVFNVRDPRLKIEIAKFCAQHKGFTIAEYIQNFAIQDEEALMEIAKLCAQDKYSRIAYYIKNFAIKNEKFRIEVAKLCAQTSPNAVERHIENFAIQDEEALIEIAKLCAQNKDSGIVEYIQNFAIKNEKFRIEVAKRCAQISPNTLERHIENFAIQDEEALIEIAKLCAQNKDSEIAYYIKNFAIQTEAFRVEIAKLCAQNKICGIACCIENFAIHDEKARIEIAKLCAQDKYSGITEYIKNFAIQDEKARIEIAKLCAQNEHSQIAYYIQNFAIQTEASRVEIAKLCVQNKIFKIAYCIRNFAIQSEAFRIEIAKLCAENSIFKLTQNYKNFNISDSNTIVELLKICINTSAEAADEILRHDPDDFLTENLLRDLWDRSIEKLVIGGYSTQKSEDRLQIIKRFVAEKIATEEKYAFLKDFLGKSPNAISYVKAYVIIKNSPDNLDSKLVEYVKSVIKYRNAFLSITMLRELFNLVLQNKIEIYKQLASIVPLRLTMIFIAKWGLKLNESTAIQNSLHSLRAPLKNATTGLMQRWLMTCEALDKSPIAEKTTLLNWICSDLGGTETTEKAKELSDRLSYLYILCKEDSHSLAVQDKDVFPRQFLEDRLMDLLRKDCYLDLSSVQNCAQKYANTLGLMRMPYAWKIYEQSLKSINDRRLQHAFQRLIVGILEGNMPAIRYDINGSDHIKHIATFHADIWGKWQQPVEGKLVELNPSLSFIDFKKFLLEKKGNGHLENQENRLNFLIEFLTNPSEENQSFIDCRNAPPGSLRAAQFYLMKLYLARDALQQIMQDDKWSELCSFLQEFEIANNLQEFKISLTKSTNAQTKLLLVDTDDWQDALLCGTEVLGSCLGIDLDPLFNKCLLAYIMDGKNRILALKDPDTGKIVARSIFRLLLNDATKQPALFQDTLYPSPMPPAFAGALNSFAKQRAHMLGLPLYTLENRLDTETSQDLLSSLGSPAPFEYEDAAQGIVENGKFTTRNTRKVISRQYY